jgi:hypothetical protein
MPTPEKTVLSFSHDPEQLRKREAAIRNGGFDVIPVSSEMAARFEIEMGRCGVLLICYTIPPPVSGELADLFRRSCPGGLIIVVTKDRQTALGHADAIVPASDDPEAIVRTLQHNLREKTG